MTRPAPNLSRRQDPVDLIKALGKLTKEDRTETRAQVFELCRHYDEDVRDEALRVLAVQWKDWSAHGLSVNALRSDLSPQVSSTGAYGVAATSRPETRQEDLIALLEVLLDDARASEVRGAAYDAILILYRRPSFPTKARPFEPEKDVDWDWIRQLQREVHVDTP